MRAREKKIWVVVFMIKILLNYFFQEMDYELIYISVNNLKRLWI